MLTFEVIDMYDNDIIISEQTTKDLKNVVIKNIERILTKQVWKIVKIEEVGNVVRYFVK